MRSYEMREYDTLAGALLQCDDASRADMLEADAVLQNTLKVRQRVYGAAHPETRIAETNLRNARADLATSRWA